jgi:serine/threonine-protein kinase
VALAHITRPFPPLPAFVPADVAALVARLTAKDPADRPGSAAEVARQARQLDGRLASAPDLVADQTDWLPGPANMPPPADRPTASVAQARRPRQLRPRRLAVIGGAAAALIAVAVLVAMNIGKPASAGHPAAAASSSAARPAPSTTLHKTSSAVTVDVDVSSLLGQPVDSVAKRLRQQGLIPRIVWQPSDQQQPGLVTAIWPAGPRPAGSVVTVVGATRVPATAAPSPPAPPAPPAGPPGGPGNGKHKGKGNGNGDG